MTVYRLACVSAALTLCLSSCGAKNGKDGSDSVPTRVHVETVEQGNFECLYNGKKIYVYKDANGDGKLSPGEEITKERTLDCPTFDR